MKIKKGLLLGLVVVLMATMLPIASTTVRAATKPKNPRVTGSVEKKDIKVVYDCITFGNYWQEDTNKDGKANKNDKKTPIKWRVLSVDGNDAFIIADQILDVQYYNKANQRITWENSTIRKWLNSSFLTDAFTDKEQKAINITNVSNKNNQFYGTNGGKDTRDRVFLLSLEDMANKKYGFSNFDLQNGDGEAVGTQKMVYERFEGEYIEYNASVVDFSRLRFPTLFANGYGYGFDEDDYKTAATANGYGCGHSGWWLRSPGEEESDASNVCYDGVDISSVNLKYKGVSPVLHIDLTKASYKSAGTVTCSAKGIVYDDKSKLANTTHSYTAKYSWSDNNTKCTAKLTCKDCGKKVSKDCIVGSNITKKATCKEDGSKTISAVLTYNGQKFTTSKKVAIKKGSHSWGTAKVTKKAELNKKGEYTYTCKVCGKKKTESFAAIKSATLSFTSIDGDGQEHIPAVTVKDTGGKTIAEKFYTITIKNSSGKKVSSPKDAGKYTVSIAFKTNYTGTITKTYEIKKSTGYTVTKSYIGNDGKELHDNMHPANTDKVKASDIPEKVSIIGYKFEGWFVDVNGEKINVTNKTYKEIRNLVGSNTFNIEAKMYSPILEPSNFSESYKKGKYYTQLQNVLNNSYTDPVELLLAIVDSQVGYMEADDYSDLAGTQKGGQNCCEYRYQVFVNRVIGDKTPAGGGNGWCNYFAAWCIYMTGGFDAQSIDSGCSLPFIKGNEANVYDYKYVEGEGRSIPQRGDILLASGHVMICYDVDYSKKSKQIIIRDGNWSNIVNNTHAEDLNNSYILKYEHLDWTQAHWNK